ncbi:MAG: PilZ domain-containing protein [Proteobacteria bacterium]|nr:PilZ domain-containing protein [Pseudomonadota bacterium]
MNKRRHPRMAMTGMVADISDGKGFYTGTVHDISRFGLALEDIPVKINSHVDHLTIILDGWGAHFKLKLSPKWENVAGRQKLIGGLIELCSNDWTDFVMRFEPEPYDVWGNS